MWINVLSGINCRSEGPWCPRDVSHGSRLSADVLSHMFRIPSFFRLLRGLCLPLSLLVNPCPLSVCFLALAVVSVCSKSLPQQLVGRSVACLIPLGPQS